MMHKRVRTYQLVRCGERRKRKNGRRAVRRCVLAGALALTLAGTVLTEVHSSNQALAADAEADHSCEAMGYYGSAGWETLADGENIFTAESVQAVNEILAAGFEAELPEVVQKDVQKDVPKERCDILVAIDAGHGGEDEGCSRGNVRETDINIEIAKATETLLSDMGYQVLLIREDDENRSLEERVQIANRAQADIFISIHQNACEEQVSKVSGIEVWYNETKGEAGSKRLAQLIHEDVLLYTGAKDRSLVADESLRVIRETDMPACLVETGFLSNKTERELLITEDYQKKLAEGIASGVDLYFFPKTMYLTFDDGPSEENTMAVLDILKRHNIKATFFLVGESVEKHPEVAKRIAQEGHTIGIHCYNHDYKKLYQSVDSYVEDFEKAWNVIYETTGVEVKLFRFPGGSINAYNKKVYADIAEEMTERGYIYFDWNASLEDATKHNEPERLLKNAKESTLGRRKIVMLAHDVVYNTTLCLEELLEEFPEYQMLPLTEEVEAIHF